VTEVKRVVIVSSKSVSLKQVSTDIMKVLERNGFISHFMEYFSPNLRTVENLHGLIFFYPLDPISAMSYGMWYKMLKPKFGDRVVFYTTIEGRINPVIVNWAVWKGVELIANSKYTFKKLSEAGFNVVDIIYHGVDFEEVKEAESVKNKLRQKLEKDFPDRVYFSVVASSHKRKGWDSLIPAIQKINEKYKDKVAFFIVTTQDMYQRLNIPNVYIVSEMGKRNHIDILGFLGAVDFHIQPSYSEGFGLPLLEAMAMGTPCLHCWFEPLSEISDKDGNIYWHYEEVKVLDSSQLKGVAIDYELHWYPPETLVEAIEMAIDIKLNHKSQYEDMKEKVREKAKEFDINKVYRYFVEKLK